MESINISNHILQQAAPFCLTQFYSAQSKCIHSVQLKSILFPALTDNSHKGPLLRSGPTLTRALEGLIDLGFSPAEPFQHEVL